MELEVFLINKNNLTYGNIISVDKENYKDSCFNNSWMLSLVVGVRHLFFWSDLIIVSDLSIKSNETNYFGGKTH